MKPSSSGGQNVNKVSTLVILEYDLNIFYYQIWFLKDIQ